MKSKVREIHEVVLVDSACFPYRKGGAIKTFVSTNAAIKYAARFLHSNEGDVIYVPRYAVIKIS